jgi:tetratricopeptide (TPR) repeat protein
MFKLKTIFSLALLAGITFLQMLPKDCLADGVDKNEIPVTCPSSSKEALQWFLNGREAYEMGRLNDANGLLDKAIQNDQRFASAYLYKAYAAASELEWRTYLGQAIINKKFVSEGEKILIDMESALSVKNSEKRLDLARQLVELYPLSSRAHLILAGEYQTRKEITKFRQMVNDAIQLNPESPLGYRSLASSYLFNEPLDFILALKNMEKFVSLRPNEPTAHLALGDVHRARLSFDRALIAFGKAIKLDPACGIAFSKKGYIEAYQGLSENARKDWEMALSLSIGNSNINWPNYNVISYLHPGCGKLPLEGIANIGLTGNNRKKKFDPLQSPEDDHYFCCTVISMKHGVYVSPFQTMNECRALQREFEKESKAPDPVMIAANLTFMEGVHALLIGDFELATKKAGEHAQLVEPGKSPKKLQVYNYLMGLIDLKQEHFANAVTHYLNSDLSNACVKYELGLAYDGLGEWDKAQEMFSEVSKCNFATASEPRMVKLSDKWLKTYASILKEE